MWDEDFEIPSYLEAIEIIQEKPSVAAMLDWIKKEEKEQDELPF